MESRAHSAIIGLFVLIGIALFLAFIAWFSKSEFDQKFDKYEISFRGPIRGLSSGSEVRFNGLRVGEVEKLRLSPEDANYVIADVKLNEGTAISTDSYAQLEPLGLTGQNYIQIFSGRSGKLMVDTELKPPYQLSGRMSQFDNFLDGGGSLISGAQGALGRVNTVMSPQAIEDFHEILTNTRVLTKKISELDIDSAQINRSLKAFEKAAIDVSAAALEVDKTALEFDAFIQNDVKSAVERAKISMAELDQTLSDFSKIATNGDVLVTDVRDAVNRLSNSGLTDLEETADALRDLSISLGNIVEKIDQNPAGFLAGSKRELVELPQ